MDMPTALDNPVDKVFERWSKAIEKVVGKGNCSMEDSATLASSKAKYATLKLLGNPTTGGDLEGDECATTISFQVDSYAKETKGASIAYSIDSESHAAMLSMGFRRTYGAELIASTDSKIKRVVSRYSCIYTGKLLGE